MSLPRPTSVISDVSSLLKNVPVSSSSPSPSAFPKKKMKMKKEKKVRPSNMNRKSELLAKRIEKAGIRASKKEGHVLTESELRNIRIQIVPNSVRAVFGVFGVIATGASYWCFTHDLVGYGVVSALISILMLLFGIFGVRRTLSRILDSMDALEAIEILGHAIKGISSGIGSLFEGL